MIVHGSTNKLMFIQTYIVFAQGYMIDIMRPNKKSSNYTFISIECMCTQNNLNKFTVCTHSTEMKGNTKNIDKHVTEMGARAQ